MDRAGAEPLRPGDPPRIGPYRLLGRIGEGGMGTVYLAEAPAGRLVAVKVVKAEFTIDEGFAARFHAEVTNARRVASFCTAQVLDSGNADDGRPYMVTEYIAGTPLSQQITRYGALEAGTLHGVALGVAAALAAIHVAGLVHRDLKPANVILSMSGPRVIDFGIARALDATQEVTRSGELLGSPGWWAPEQVRGEEITPAADVFAWGCLVAYAGNGRHPYGRGDLMTLASRVLTGRPDLGTLPAPLDRLARLATEADPQRRPSAQYLLIALVGGEIALPQPALAEAPTLVAPADPPTLVASELLSESWEPPANVAAAASDVVTSDPGHSDPGRSDTAAATMPRQGARKWLVPALTVLTGLLVTGGVLVMVLPDRSPVGVAAVTSPVTTTSATPQTDVGHRFTVGSYLEDVQFVIPRPPECEGRFCVIRWTLMNPGGTSASIGATPPALVDDRGGEHKALQVSTPTPDTLEPGGKASGVFVYDLPAARGPATLRVRVSDTKTIEVRL